MRFRINLGGTVPPRASFGHLRAFRNNETRRRTLGVVLHHEVVGERVSDIMRIVGSGGSARARHGGHDDAVPEFLTTNGEAGEESFVGHDDGNEVVVVVLLFAFDLCCKLFCVLLLFQWLSLSAVSAIWPD